MQPYGVCFAKTKASTIDLLLTNFGEAYQVEYRQLSIVFDVMLTQLC